MPTVTSHHSNFLPQTRKGQIMAGMEDTSRQNVEIPTQVHAEIPIRMPGTDWLFLAGVAWLCCGDPLKTRKAAEWLKTNNVKCAANYGDEKLYEHSAIVKTMRSAK